jgi:hypothetical protein
VDDVEGLEDGFLEGGKGVSCPGASIAADEGELVLFEVLGADFDAEGDTLHTYQRPSHPTKLHTQTG